MTLTIPPAPQRVWRTTRCRLGELLAVAALLGTIACGTGSDSTTGPTNKNPAGIYGLRQVDGKTVPAEVAREHSDDPDTGVSLDAVMQITGGEIILSEDGTFRLTVDYVILVGGEDLRATVGGTGTYEITGNAISFTEITGSAVSPIDGNVTGTLRNGDITVELAAFGKKQTRKFVYRYAP